MNAPAWTSTFTGVGERGPGRSRAAYPEETGRHVLCELAKAVGVVRAPAIAEDEPGREGVPTVEEPARWRRRYPKPARSTAAEEPDDSRG